MDSNLKIKSRKGPMNNSNSNRKSGQRHRVDDDPAHKEQQEQNQDGLLDLDLIDGQLQRQQFDDENDVGDDDDDDEDEDEEAQLKANGKKWKCAQCTYENWPSSIKCTICLASKTTPAGQRLSSPNGNVRTHDKIELVSCGVQQPDNNEKPPVDNHTNNGGKWSCPQCTYLNWPKSNKCIQCYTPKAAQPSPPTTTCDNENIYNLNSSSNNNLNSLEPVAARKAPQCTSSPPANRSLCSSPCNVISSISTSNGELNSGVEQQQQQPAAAQSQSQTVNSKKWSCSACTYQNWPKSQRCVMCLVPRNASLPASNSVKNTSGNKNLHNQHKQPPNQHLQQQQQQQVINLKKQKQLLNYQIQMDRLFLAACQGIVDGDMTYLNRYVNAGGDLTRYLTSDECKYLNKPNVFKVGLTLLHLCYQFKRKDFLIKLLNKTTTTVQQQQQQQQQQMKPTPVYQTTKYLNTMLRQINISSKFSPCQSCPSLASNIIDRYFSACLRQRKIPNSLTQRYMLNEQLLSMGATNATLLGSNGMNNNSPTSSLISLAQHQNGSSPSPSPPPCTSGGAAAAAACCGASGSSLALSHSCFHVNESHTFTLPNEIEDFSPKIQNVLFDELLDREVQQELEYESRIINWNLDLCKRLNSRLYPLWNRHSGDCLLDSVLQACYGVFDTDNILRRVMAESLEQYAAFFKPRWKEHEILMAQSLEYKIDDYQLEQDWNNILALANQPGSSLEQAHIFALCHIFRRPIIVYSVKYVKSFRGENIGFTHFEGVYLPLIWEPSFCFKSPIALGYTRGHFTALVPLDRSEIYVYATGNNTAINNNNNNSCTNLNANLSNGTNGNNGSNGNLNLNSNGTNNCNVNNANDNPTNGNGANPIANLNNNMSQQATTNSSSTSLGAVSIQDYNETPNQQTFYLPLTNNEGKLLPVHFLTNSELGRERTILRQYLNLDCFVTQGNCGLLVAQQRVVKRGMLVKQMLDEWLSYYRNMQLKENSKQIEVIQEKNSEDRLVITNSEYNNDDDDDEDDDEDEDDDDVDEDDDDEDEDDDDEDEDFVVDVEDEDEDEYDDEYCEKVNVQ